MMGYWGNGMGAWGWIGMSVFWLVLIGLIVWTLARVWPGDRLREHSAIDTLDERLARGEIDVETYQRLRTELSRATGAARR